MAMNVEGAQLPDGRASSGRDWVGAQDQRSFLLGCSFSHAEFLSLLPELWYLAERSRDLSRSFTHRKASYSCQMLSLRARGSRVDGEGPAFSLGR